MTSFKVIGTDYWARPCDEIPTQINMNSAENLSGTQHFIEGKSRTVHALSLGKTRWHRAKIVHRLFPKMPGCGRARSRTTAILKAESELVERLAMISVYKNLKKIPSQDCEITGARVSVGPRFTIPRPPIGFRNSNGWATYPSLEGAIRNAIFESIERTILQMTYVIHGWRGFRCISRNFFYGYDAYSLVSRYRLGHFGAGLVALKLKNRAGFTFGYLADFSNHLLESPRWAHALFEAFDPAVTFDAMTGDLPKDDVLMGTQSHYASSYPTAIPLTVGRSPSRLIRLSKNVRFHLSTFELISSRRPTLYAAHAGYGDLWPLILPQICGKPEFNFWKKWCAKSISQSGFPRVHPIL